MKTLTTTMVALLAMAASQNSTDPGFEELSRLITQKMAEYHIPGVAFGILKNGQMTVRGFGVTNIEDPLPVTGDTVFPIASISKTFAATAMVRLAQQGKLDLDAPVQRYLPEFRVGDETASREVAVWHLLTHMPGWEGQLNTVDRGTETLNVFVQSMRENPQIARPGEVWSYNNAGFGVAGRIIEVVTGKNINDALSELVYQPLKLTRASGRTGDAVTHRFALGHRDREGAPTVIRPYNLPPSVTAGGIATSINDLLTYAKAHLTDPSLQDMRQPRVKKNGTDDEMGLGWHLRKLNGVTTAAHGGTLGGHILLLELVPERNMALSLLTNHSNGWRLIQEVERAALKLYEGISLDARQVIGHRGINETRPDQTAMTPQPGLAEYVGVYKRTPLNDVAVREVNGRLMIGETVLAFYAPDRAYATQTGSMYEFIRKTDGSIGWIRVVGRIARKN
jgi:CubicO group peptidase (beta-lactamase class C family)